MVYNFEIPGYNYSMHIHMNTQLQLAMCVNTCMSLCACAALYIEVGGIDNQQDIKTHGSESCGQGKQN